MVRLFDLFWSVAGLLALSPFLLVVGLLIKLTDGGPVFYRQVRVGRHGAPFRIIKFRTMSASADGGGLPLTIGRDRRITPFGSWLRRWKIDELPQLINVVLGQMSLVGPRPEVPRYVGLYTLEQTEVLKLRPGVTDAASIAYRYENEILQECEDPEAFYIQHILPNKIRINLDYAATATLGSHIKVILATLGLHAPPVPPRQPGDRRAFDRSACSAAVQVTVNGAATRHLHAANIGRGGILLQPAEPMPLGLPCSLVISLPPGVPEPTQVEGITLRADQHGVAVGFLHPLAARPNKPGEE